MTSQFQPPIRARDAEHSIVYRNDREFCGWPFISGFWTVAEGHHLVAFKKKPASYTSAADVHHDEVAKVGPQMVTLRTRDNGRSWDPGSLQLLYDLGADQDAMFAGGPPDYAADPPVDFLDRNVLVASGATPDYFRPHSRAWIRVSTDGGSTWRRPILATNAGLPSLSGHASPLVRPDGVCLLFMTAVSADGWKRRPVVYAAVEGGAYWTFVSMITPNADDGAADSERNVGLRFGAHRYFYPRGIMLPDGAIIVAVRCQRDPTSILWTEIFRSVDGGRTWGFLSRVNDWGAPGDLVRMRDGRIACVYGYRLPPFGLRARLSSDGGATWGREIVLRDDGGSWDLGYPRVIEHVPGRLLTVYYMNCKDDPIQMNGGVRHIAQTVFTPD
ncbi:MAG: exo-alpha-sialidase [Alphaproteobacteria bacterium]|nr:exo-alpha-sialidase [Alphaproteobacteria bacterium]